VSSSELFRTLNSEVNERSIAGLPSFPPFIACITVPALVLLCRNFAVLYNTDLCSFIKLSFLYFLIV